ncbi:MAG TPA: PEP-utilizing enzyme, partial [Candidatus Obscuribacterales bacterium]
LTPLSRGILQRAANDWLDLLVPEMRESEVSAYDWFESLAGRLLLPTGRFQALLGYTPGQPGAIQLKDLSRLTSIRKHLRRLSKQIWDTFVVSHPRFQGNLQQWQEICRLFLPAYLELGALIRSLAAGLESSESLAAYLADHLNPSSRLHDQLIPLWERVQDQLAEAAADEDADPGQMSEKMLGQPEFKRQWQLFMSHYGHYAPFALDLAYPRLFDQPEALIETLMQPWSSDDFTGVWNKRGWLERPRWQQLARIIDLRENFLNDVLWALHQLRIRMQARAEELVTAGRLESAADIWWLTPTELGRLDLEQSVPPGLVAMRRAQQQSWQATWRRLAGEAELADTDDADDTGGSDQGHVLMGQGLQTLMVVGKVWWLDAPAIHLPEGYEPGRTILVTETVDPGWIPCLEQVGGVILTGCDVLSAAAIMLRELGKPAIIALPQAAALAEGQWLRLNTETGTVSLIEEVS